MAAMQPHRSGVAGKHEDKRARIAHLKRAVADADSAVIVLRNAKPATSADVLTLLEEERAQVVRLKDISAELRSPFPTDVAVEEAAVDEIDRRITTLEEQLDSVGDDAQLANVDLQNVLQKQQQTLQMISSISRLINDTSMAVIRNIGG